MLKYIIIHQFDKFIENLDDIVDIFVIIIYGNKF